MFSFTQKQPTKKSMMETLMESMMMMNEQKDILVADSVLELFRRRQNIENFNKKALYIMIREMTGSNTQHITRVVNQMKKYFVATVALI